MSDPMPIAESLSYPTLLAGCASTLALAGAWLNPLETAQRSGTNPGLTAWWDEDQEQMLERLRDYFPDSFVEFHRLTYEGVSPVQRDMQIVSEINTTLPAGTDGLYDLDQINWGIPVEFLGCGVGDEGFWEGSRAAPVAALFHYDDVDNDNFRFHAGRILSKGLSDIDPDQSRLVDWLFSQTGNSLADNSWQEGQENYTEPLAWDELDFYHEMYGEAADMQACAIDALAWLEDDDDRFGVFCSNVVIAYCAGIQEVFHDRRAIHPAFIRPVPDGAATGGDGEPGRGDSGAANPGDSVFPVRDCAAA